MEERVYECEGKDHGKLKALLERESLADVSFARQGYKLKEGRAVGGEPGKYYLYISAEPSFFKWAEEKLKEVPSAKRAPKEAEEKIIAEIRKEEEAAESGFGAIFG